MDMFVWVIGHATSCKILTQWHQLILDQHVDPVTCNTPVIAARVWSLVAKRRVGAPGGVSEVRVR